MGIESRGAPIIGQIVSVRQIPIPVGILVVATTVGVVSTWLESRPAAFEETSYES
jgi:hypothetical protein